MKNILTKISENSDLELLNILKSDIQEQHHKVKFKIINMATKVYDNQLLDIIKIDIVLIRSKFCNSNLGLINAI